MGRDIYRRYIFRFCLLRPTNTYTNLLLFLYQVRPYIVRGPLTRNLFSRSCLRIGDLRFYDAELWRDYNNKKPNHWWPDAQQQDKDENRKEWPTVFFFIKIFYLRVANLMIHNQMSHNEAKKWVLSLIYRAAIDF